MTKYWKRNFKTQNGEMAEYEHFYFSVLVLIMRFHAVARMEIKPCSQEITSKNLSEFGTF